MIIQRALPWFVTFVISEGFCRLPPMVLANGVTLAGAKLLPRPSGTLIKQVYAGTHHRITQPRHGNDLHELDSLFMQPHDLLAPLVELFQCLLSCVFFFRPGVI